MSLFVFLTANHVDDIVLLFCCRCEETSFTWPDHHVVHAVHEIASGLQPGTTGLLTRICSLTAQRVMCV